MSDHPLTAFAAALWQPDDLVELRRITPPPPDKPDAKPKIRQSYLRASEIAKPGTLAMLALENTNGANIYAIINPLREQGGSDEHVLLTRALFVDFDGGISPEQALAKIQAASLPRPSLVLFSGHGTHCYWLLSEPLEDLTRWRGIHQALINMLDSDDKIKNPSRVMRLPGFKNCKYEPHVEATLVEVHTDRRYTLDQFPAPVDAAPNRANGEVVAHRITAHDGAPAGAGNLSRKTLLFLHQGAAEGERNDALFKAACDYAGCGLPQSQAQQDLGRAALKCGLTDGEISTAIESAYSKPRGPSRPADTAAASPEKPTVDALFEHASGTVRIECKRGDEPSRAVLTVWDKERPALSDDIKINGARSRSEFLKRADRAFPGLDAESVEQFLVAKAVEFSAPSEQEDAEQGLTRAELLSQADMRNEQLVNATPPGALREAEDLLQDPRLMDRILEDIEAVGVVGEQPLALTVYLQAVSRLLRRPLSVITQGLTSSGKNHVQECVGLLLPAEAVLVATHITTNALYYLKPGSLMHVFVMAGERSRKQDDDHAEATKALREMISAGELRKLVPERTADGQMVTRNLWQPGPIAYIESTTLVKVFDEDANRCLRVGTDESPEQTARIVLAQAVAAMEDGPDTAGIFARHHALHRLLRRCDVRIPYARAIARAIPTIRQEARRAMPQILTMIKAVALLHQRQRVRGPVEHGTRLLATLDDYAIARHLLVGPMGRSLGGGLPDAVTRFAKRLIERHGTEEFDTAEVTKTDEHLNSRSKVNDYLAALEEAGVAKCVEPSKGRKPSEWKIVGALPEPGEAWLPTLDQLREEGA